MSTDEKNIFHFKDVKVEPDPILEYTPSLHNVPLVIDNGSYQCRAGWAVHSQPDFIFKNITAKQRGKKESDIQIGNDIANIEVVRWILRSQFDRNVVTLYDVQESIFDYIFSHLGINTEQSVDHPIVLTEPVCNPNACRQQMSELLFECYHVPQVAYGVDALFSLYCNHPKPESATALLVDCGYQTTHILPVVDGRLDAGHCRRINLGGAHADLFMQRLLQLKYPVHLQAITLTRAEELVRDHTEISVNYLEDLKEWEDIDYYENNVRKLQLPFTNTQSSTASADSQRERRQQQIKRLKEMNAKRRNEKLQADEEQLQELMSVQELLVDKDEAVFVKALQEVGYKTAEQLQVAINKLTVGIQRAKAKILGMEPPPEEPEVKVPVFDLLDIPDEMLLPDQLETKKRQRILKAAREGRARAQALQRAKRQKEMEDERRMEEKRQTDFTGWLQEVRMKRQKILDSRNVRRQRKTDMAKRRTYASQQRMKIISQLAQKSSKKDDNFGQNDADWEVYKEINTEAGTSDSEADDEKLEEIETMLREYDPEFQKEMDANAVPAQEFNIAEYYRLHVGVEKIRVPELLFQPSMLGIEQAGVAETMNFVLKKFQPPQQNSLVQYVYLTGACSSFPNFKVRLEKELLEMRPFQSTFKVVTAADPVLGAWQGARKWALSPYLSTCSITKADYAEKGEEYLKEHLASNRYFPSPSAKPPQA